MFPPYGQELAHHYCLDVISKINDGHFLLKQVSKESVERKNQGVMIGTLVCWNKPKKKRLVLVAVSGIAKKLEIPESKKSEYIIVPDIANALKISAALQKNDFQIHQLTYQINDLQKLLIEKSNCNADFVDFLQIKNKIELLTNQRTKLTDQSLKKVFYLYRFHTINHTKISLNQIIKERANKLPPTGTGDCCAPKLLSYAFSKKLIPISLDEVYFGQNTKNKENGKSYPPCDERCGILLPYLLGLKVLYKDSQIIVVEKPSMLLSVPGKTEDKQDCVVSRVKTFLPFDLQISQPSVHRLDMETSGLLVLALTEQAHKNLSIQFASQKVYKVYEAVLDGIIEKSNGKLAPKNGQTEGQIQLKFRVDLENRPYQIYDEENGLLGITKWKKLGVETYISPFTKEKRKVTRVEFEPITGRTHQLRLASSHANGLGLPIIGDSLYGTCQQGERLLLHAKYLEFLHPTSNKKMQFYSKPDF